MKKMKRLVALALSVVMVLAMSVVAFADDETTKTSNYTITINEATEGHSYEAYQIFAGDLSKGTLSNITWGDGVTSDGQAALGDAAAKASTLKSEADAIALAKAVAPYLYLEKAKLSGTYNTTAKNYTIGNLAAGYYLVKDKDNSLEGKNDFYTAYIMKVVGNVSATPKGDKPSFEKKIKDANDTNDTTETINDWQDSADYDIGDQVPFKLEGTVASNYDAYKHYYFAFHDVEENGLSFNADSVRVFVDNTEITRNSAYKVATKTSMNPAISDQECTFEVIFEDLKELKVNNEKIVKAGSKIRVEYTSELTAQANLGSHGNVNKAKLEFSNNPNSDPAGKPDKPGETPWDNVIVFTYKVVVNKVDQDGKALKGAKFTLKKKIKGGDPVEVAVVETNEGTTFTFKGLDDGEYILEETTTPEEYNTISPITFTVNANHTITWDGTNRNQVLKSLTGNKVPGEITLTPDVTEGSLTTNIENKKGSTLPSTGGIGTTIFYVVGAILMVGAAVLLITKRRAEN